MTNETDQVPEPAAKRGRPKKRPEIADALAFNDDEPEVEFATNREMADEDPIMGGPMGFFRDGEDAPVWIEPGQWVNYPEFINPKSKLPFNIPVEALGVDSDGLHYYYFNTLGHTVKIKGSDGKGVFELLFAGRSRYLIWLFPRISKDGFVVGWEADDLKRALTDWAGYEETFDDEEAVRGRGMWQDDRGRPVVHAGNAVFYNGEWRKPGRHGEHIYPARPRTGRPRRHRDLRDVGSMVLKIYETWSWERPALDPKLKLGWVMTAKMAGALYRRPFVWLTGPRGSGKSYMQAFSRSLMHGALFASSNTSAAAIYRKLGKDSIPVMLDEQESKSDTTITDRLLDIMRAAYTGDGLDRVGENGKTVTFMLRSSFLASSIGKPSMETSDESRMALLSLRKNNRKDAAYDLTEAYRMGQQLSLRAVQWFGRWDLLLKNLDQAMRERVGHEARSIETFAPLIAGYHIAMHDDMPTEAQYAEYADLLDPSTLTELQSQVEDWEKCIRHMLGAIPDVLKNRARKTIGQYLVSYLKSVSGDETDAEEGMSGFRVCITWRKSAPQTKENALLFIPNTDPALVDLFEGTSWKGRKGNTGAWNGVLKQAPRELWEDYSSTKGGFGTVRGVAFKLEALMAHLTGEGGDGAVEEQKEMPLTPFDPHEDAWK